jgi:uncharacterized integral membrane protein
MVILTLILGFAIAIVAVIFALQNTATVEVAFFTLHVTGSLALVVLVTLAAGILIGILVMTPSLIKRSISISSHRKKIKGLEKLLDEHKTKLEEIEKSSPAIQATEEPKPEPQSDSASQQIL